jgi:hypothetical protein
MSTRTQHTVHTCTPDTVRPFVHVEERAHTVSSAVTIVQTVLSHCVSGHESGKETGKRVPGTAACAP